jgi:hypothetical protein
MDNAFFPNMITTLRGEEAIVLYGYLLEVTEEDCALVTAFLSAEYAREALDYPYTAPPFDAEAALWAAKTVYTAAQLVLYREHNVGDLEALFPSFPGEQTASAALSADLCLRFLPPLLYQVELIDPDDKLILLLRQALHVWHYSGVTYPLDHAETDFTQAANNPCWMRLYCDRITQHKNEQLALHPAFSQQILADLGDYAGRFWKTLITTTSNHE